MLFLNNDDVARVIDMELCLEALERLFREMATGDATGMGRMDMYLPSGQPSPFHRLAFMAGGSRQTGYACLRIISDMVSWPMESGHRRENKYARQPGTYCGLIMLLSTRDATPVAIMNDGKLQHDRVGAGAGLGAKYISREDSRTVGMIGSGGMARSYLDALRRVRPIERVKVYSLNTEHVREYADEMHATHGIEVQAAPSAREAVRQTDIVCLCTSSIEPVFFEDWLEPGMHVIDVNRNSVGPEFLRAVDVAVRPGDATPYLEHLPPDAFYARGGYLGYVAGEEKEKALIPRVALEPDIVNIAKLPDVIRGAVRGRTGPQQTSWFMNIGAIGPQFAAVAAAVYEKARETGLGQELPTEMFLENIRA